MPARGSERGFISFGVVVTLLLLAVLVFAAFKLLPPYINNYQLQDEIANLARAATYSQMSEAEIRKQVIARAADNGIILAERQVVVRRTTTSVDIAVQYAIEVDLIAQQVVLNFAPAAGNRNIAAR